jgi:uncharacterized membrane protein YkoI
VVSVHDEGRQHEGQSDHEVRCARGDRLRARGRQLRRRERRERVGRDHDDDGHAHAVGGRTNAQQPWGGQRSDETPLTGDTLAKVTAAAQAKVSGGTIVRVETDAVGHAAYEAHMTKSDGTPVTVYVDKSFDVVSVESR